MYPYAGGLGLVETAPSFIPTLQTRCPAGMLNIGGTRTTKCVPLTDIVYADVPQTTVPTIVPIERPTVPTWETVDLVPTPEAAPAAAPAFNVKALLPIAAIAAAFWLM